MEAYTLWWNGGTFREMLDYNTKYFPITYNHTLLWQRGPDMEGHTQLVAFKRTRAKLAWAFINIMNATHHCGIFHNNLSEDNIMLHFLGNKPNVMYIACAIGVKMGTYKRWHHHYMGLQRSLQRSKMSPTQKKSICGLPHNCFLFTMSWEQQIPLDKWPSSMPQLWGLKHIWWAC